MSIKTHSNRSYALAQLALCMQEAFPCKLGSLATHISFSGIPFTYENSEATELLNSCFQVPPHPFTHERMEHHACKAAYHSASRALSQTVKCESDKE